MKTKLLLISLLSILVTALVAPAVRAVPATGPWYQPKPGDQNPLIMAHQGGEGEYPSNTMLAFTKAQQAGADALDTDMFATSDGELVLFHDENLEHRTNCTGPISARTYAYLAQNCDAAYWWTPTGSAPYPHRGTGIKIPKFQELLTAFPNSRIGIEIKQTTLQAATTLCSVITANNAQGRVLVSSSTQPNMDQFRIACPTVATSATILEVGRFLAPEPYTPPFSSLQVPIALQIDTNFVTKAHNLGVKVYAWTIDTPAQTQPLIDAGVDGVNTSFPKRIIDWFATPLKSCGTLGTTYKLTTPPTSHLCVWVIQSWMNEARDKYDQENNPAWPSVATDGVYNTTTKNLVTVWQYMSNSHYPIVGLPVTGEANPATLNHMSLACVTAETTYAYNSSLC